MDDLVEGRYESYSEVLRTAIEEHYQTVNEDDDTVYERIIDRISTLISEIEEIHEKLESIEDNNQVHAIPTNQALTDQSEVPNNPVTSTSTQRFSEVEIDVYDELLEDWPQTIPDLAENVDVRKLDVREAIESLRDRGHVVHASGDTDQLAYLPTGINGD